MNSINMELSRRAFLASTVASATVFPMLSNGMTLAKDDLHHYDTVLRDRLWMWGHGPGTTNGVCNIPVGNNIDMADAIRSMGIPNVCVIRWMGKPEPPFDEYIKQFQNTKRVAWSIVDGTPQAYEQKKQWAFELLEKMPNLVGFYLDDYFHGDAIPQAGENISPACLTLDQLRDLRNEVQKQKQKPELTVVLYSNQLHAGIKPHLDFCDAVSFWTWHATDLVALEANFRKYRSIVPDKPTLLGVYMWDFGNAKPITMELMKLQLEFALKKFQEKEIEGMIFHCTPLCDLELEAVDYSRKWIAEHGNVAR